MENCAFFAEISLFSSAEFGPYLSYFMQSCGGRSSLKEKWLDCGGWL